MADKRDLFQVALVLLVAGAAGWASTYLPDEYLSSCAGMTCTQASESLARQPVELVWILGGIATCLLVIGVLLLAYKARWGRRGSP